MQEAEQQIYLQLVQELLNCPQGQEQKLLATKPDLVNEKLIEALLIVADFLEQREGAESESNIPWLRQFARNLAEALGSGVVSAENEEQDHSADFTQADLDFLNALIKAEQEDSSQVQQLFAQNIQRLTPQLGATMKWSMEQVLEKDRIAAEYYASLLENILIELFNFPLGNIAQNLEIVIVGFMVVLAVRLKENNPEQWSDTQNNLANAYWKRIRGDRAENLERSIACNKSALEIRTKADLPIDWAQTQNNLAAAYGGRIRGDRAENLELSIECYQSALEIRTKIDLPIDWAQTQNNLAAAYGERIRGDRAENLELSIECYQSALKVYTSQDLPIQWADTQNNLGIVYWKRTIGDLAENIERSIECYQSALKIRTKIDMPINWAQTQNNLGIVYWQRIRGNRIKNRERSVECYQFALEIRTPENFPIECLQTAQNLGNLHFYAKNWQQAIDSYTLAITAVELSRSWANSEQSKQEIIEKAIQVYFNLVQCCINTQQYDKALEYAERSKSRNLVELLATRDLYPKGDIPTDILSQLDTLRRQVLSEERRIGQRSDFGNSIDPGSRGIATQNTTGIDPDRERLFTLKQDLDNLIIDRVQPIDPSFQLTQQVQSIDFATMQSALPNAQTALLTWYISNSRIHAFLVTPFHRQPYVINSTPEQYEALDSLRATYLDTYRTDKQTWRETLPNLLQQISEIINLPEIIKTLLQLNSDCNQIILIPHRILHLLPLHALPLNEAGDCLLDLFPGGVSYAPSIQLLKLSQKWHRPALQSLFAIQNPTNDLQYTDVEVPAICDRFQPHVEIVKGKQADKAALSSEGLNRANCVHFSCHGSFNFENPLASALILSGGTTDLDKCLTLGEIFQLDLRQCGLVTLSACETGLTDFRSMGDEYIGLPSGFLYAGSSNVVSSLWAVSDLSTTFLMIKFYQNLKEADSVAIALNHSQTWLRQITKSELLEWITSLNLGSSKKLLVESWRDTLKSVDDRAMLFQSPYHWAAFCAIG
jgi:CHAT domain-containing protein